LRRVDPVGLGDKATHNLVGYVVLEAAAEVFSAGVTAGVAAGAVGGDEPWTGGQEKPLEMLVRFLPG
jgi:hypothetical protein